MKVESESEVAQSCPTLSNHMDCSLPGSSVHGIFQARVLVWGAIAFSDFFDYTPVKVNFEKKSKYGCIHFKKIAKIEKVNMLIFIKDIFLIFI